MKSYALLSLLVAGAVAQAPQAVSIKEGAPPPPGAPRVQTILVGGVTPGPDGQPTRNFIFSPEAVTAAPGDTIRFMFMDSENAVVQSTFEAPCAPKAGGFVAGPLPNPNSVNPGPTQDLQVTSPEPLWMTSKAAGACGVGMVFSVNAPPQQQHSFFKATAIKAQGQGLKNAAIIAEQPVQQIASTVTVNPANVAAATGVPGVAPQVIAGQGQTGSGQACGCSCLCGAGPAPPNVGVGAFGGVLGEMPSMSPANGTPALGQMQPPPAGAAPPPPARQRS